MEENKWMVAGLAYCNIESCQRSLRDVALVQPLPRVCRVGARCSSSIDSKAARRHVGSHFDEPLSAYQPPNRTQTLVYPYLTTRDHQSISFCGAAGPSAQPFIRSLVDEDERVALEHLKAELEQNRRLIGTRQYARI